LSNLRQPHHCLHDTGDGVETGGGILDHLSRGVSVYGTDPQQGRDDQIAAMAGLGEYGSDPDLPLLGAHGHTGGEEQGFQLPVLTVQWMILFKECVVTLHGRLLVTAIRYAGGSPRSPPPRVHRESMDDNRQAPRAQCTVRACVHAAISSWRSYATV